MGWDVINMTAYPEAMLARELELCYANISMVTDYDVGVDGATADSARPSSRVFAENNERLRDLLFAAIPRIGPQPEDGASARPRSRAPASRSTVRKLSARCGRGGLPRAGPSSEVVDEEPGTVTGMEVSVA